jgi:hypothetical protein
MWIETFNKIKVITMKTEEQTELTETEVNGEENIPSVFKPFLLGIVGLAIVMAIFVLLPMLFTYLSSGDVRAPSQIHAPDPVGRSDQTIYKPTKPQK